MTRLILVCSLFAFEIAAGSLLAAPLFAQDSAPPPDARPGPVTRLEVWQAVVAELRDRGLKEPQLPRMEDLDLPVALPALAGRHLRVASACWDEGPDRAQFRLECSEPGQCLPFLVYVRGEGKSNAGARTGLCGLAPDAHPPLGSRLAPKAAPKPAMRAGDRGTAVYVSDRLRITASVTCLERGGEGDVIRVRNQDGEVFRARISGPALLEAVPQ
ncbi:MAG: flagella basal body P-ring formation protein FlgA [Terriglobales bacterium]